jgi:hypothetical protein
MEVLEMDDKVCAEAVLFGQKLFAAMIAKLC